MREKIIQAGLELFPQYGFRKTSMAQIASQACVAKPTLYAHFTDKETLFTAVCEQVMHSILVEAKSIQRSKRPLAERLEAMLSAKFTALYELVHRSPHAQELLQARNEQARSIIADADARFTTLIHTTLLTAQSKGEIDPGHKPLELMELTNVLLQSAYGAKYQASSVEDHRSHIRQAVHWLLLAVRPTTSSSVSRTKVSG
jgi:AcrR family transcriptional regulator